MTQPLACPKCRARPGQPPPDAAPWNPVVPPFQITVSYEATVSGQVTGLDDGDMLVDWSTTRTLARFLDRWLRCSWCAHVWRTQRVWAAPPAP